MRSVVQSALGSGSRSGQVQSNVQCAAFCEVDLNFEVGVVRCPNGSISEHQWGPFYHPDCLPNSGKCPACQLMLGNVASYVVHDAHTVPQAPAETWTPVTAARWAGCTMRQVGMLCHATSAAAIWQSFGHQKTPYECANEWAFSIQGRSNYPQYTTQYTKFAAKLPSGSSVAQVHALMADDDAGAYAITELTSKFGEPILTGVGTVKRVTTISFTGPSGIQSAIDTNKLILVGDYNHCIVVCGYSTSTRGGQRVIYYDPMSGATKQDGCDSFLASKEEFLIVG
ncbi:MAG TPA: hypothetical protein VGI74_05545 [Streptosporangiaceae bacterium]